MSDEAQGLRPIGNLIPKIASMPSAEASTPMMSPSASETSGTPRPALTPVSATGTRHGELGAATRLPAVLAAPMAGSDPLKTDAALRATCEQQLGQPLVLRTREFFGPHGYDYETLGYDLARPVEVERLHAAQQLVAAALRPTPPMVVIEELARLRRLTKSRAEDETDREATYVALAEELSEFPPDVVRGALRKIARRETFFPSLAELRDQCQRDFRKRRLIARAVGIEEH